MDPRLRMRIEIETLHELVDELNYYRLLQLDCDCAQDEIGPAFRRESRRLHPDRMATFKDATFREKGNYILKWKTRKIKIWPKKLIWQPIVF